MRTIITSEDELEEVKEKIKECVQKLLEDFNEVIMKENGEIFFKADEKWQTVKPKDGKDIDSLSFPSIYAIQPSFLRDIFEKKFLSEKYSVYREYFRINGLLDDEDEISKRGYSILVDSLFGNLFIKYMYKITEHRKKQDISYLPLKFDMELFHRCWEGVLLWITNKSIKIKYYYFFFNTRITIKGESINLSDNLEIKKPSINERVSLIEEIQFDKSYFEGLIKISRRMSTILNCDFWIEGEKEITSEDVFRCYSSEPIIHQDHIEEALLLIQDNRVESCFLTVSDYFLAKHILLIPSKTNNITAIDTLSDIAVYPYPKEMDQFLSRNRGRKEELKDEEIELLSRYLKFSSNLTIDSQERLVLDRFVSSLKRLEFKEIIIEVVFGIEALLVKGGSISWKFKTNTSWLVGKSYEDRQKISDFCGGIYTLRNTIAHDGGKDTERILAKMKGKKSKVQDLAKRLLRLVILLFTSYNADSLEFIDRDLINEHIQEAILGKELKIHRTNILEKHYKDFMERLESLK